MVSVSCPVRRPTVWGPTVAVFSWWALAFADAFSLQRGCPPVRPARPLGGGGTRESQATNPLARRATMQEEEKSNSEKNNLAFSKYHGLGNDFILVDNRGHSDPLVSPDAAAALCDRNFGVGADGVIFVLDADHQSNDLKMRIYNSDSSEPEMCGNGIRCLAQFVQKELRVEGSSFRIETGAGVITPQVLPDGRVRVDMGEPELSAGKVPTTLNPTRKEDWVVEGGPVGVAPSSEHHPEGFLVTCVSMGNPHAVTFLDSLDSFDLLAVGPRCEIDPAFPSRVNTEFVEVVDRQTLKMVVYERGAGPTLACGTGACAVVVAAVLTDRADRNCVVKLPGGDLGIEWREDDNRCYMTGPAEFVFTGTLAGTPRIMMPHVDKTRRE